MDSTPTAGQFIFVFVSLAILAAFYLLPGVVASSRRHPQRGAIWILTICLGWTLVGWVAALVWACTNSQRVVLERSEMPLASTATPAPVSTADEIEQFSRLKESGVITAEEFEAKKRQLLGLV